VAKKKKPTGATPPSSGEYIDMRKDMLKKLGSKVAFGEDIDDTKLDSISTGSFKLDWALGMPLLEGSINELYGNEQTGKTTLALEASASAIKMGKPVFYFDLERKLRESSLNMIKGLSGDARQLFTRIRPDTGEEAVDLVHDCIMDFPGCFIVFDSVSAMMPEVEGAELASKQMMGKVAKLCWRMLRKVMGPNERNRCCILFISHISPKLNPYQTGDNKKGGKAISNLASQVIKLKRTAADILKTTKGDPYGQMTQCEIIKNNMARPFRKVTVPLIWGKGIDKALDLAQLARDLGVVDYASGWYITNYQCEDKDTFKRLREADFLEVLRTDKEYRAEIVKSVKELLG
jgi:recombination protein RecA